MTKTFKGFASDNYSGVHPEILTALQKANFGHARAYGDDQYTEKAIEKFREHFGKDVDVSFVFNGTAANVLALKAVTESFNSIICADTAHINVDECCAPEKFTDCKLITVPTNDGKISVEKIKKHVRGFGDQHHAQPKVISITNPTELGTIYSPDEIQEIADFAHKNEMFLHLDGARLCNAAASLKKSLKAISFDLGVDLVSFGGTKNGMMFGEAIIFRDKKLSKNFQFIRKQGMQLASKMRFLSVQFQTLLSNNLWLKNAEHSNKIAKILANEVKKIPQIKITQKVEANSVFATIPKKFIPILQKEYFFYVWNEQTSEIRWMCTFDTTEEEIKNFVSKIGKLMK